MIDYSLAAKLKDAGFPQPKLRNQDERDVRYFCEGTAKEAYIPTLSELIEACGDDFLFLSRNQVTEGWTAESHKHRRQGSTPEEAVANLWLALNPQ